VPLTAEASKPYLPDFAARQRKIFGDNVMTVSGADIAAWDRGER
jgi:hypothetical protein